MGGVLESAGGFLGLSSGPEVGVQRGNKALDQLMDDVEQSKKTPYRQAVQNYLLGNKNLNEVIDSAGGQQQWLRDFAVDPLAGSRMATEEVQRNPILGQLFGKGGALERAGAEEQKLASQGFKLQPEDIEAYGQASGDIARLFGGQEKDLAQQLAARGLSAAPSGAAGQQYSGLLGNKYEQLARAQTDIANKRMQNTLQRLNSTRQYQLGLGQQGASAVQDQYGRALSGIAQRNQDIGRAAALTSGQQGAENQAELAAAQFKKSAKPKNFMDFATAGIGKGIESGAENATSKAFTGAGI